MSELNSIFVQDKEVKVFGADIKIKSLKLGDIPLAVDIYKKVQVDGGDLKSNVLSFISNEFPSAIKLIEACTNLTADQIQKLNIAASMVIVTEIIQENASFLQSHVIPQIGRMATTMSSVGLNKSNS